MEFEKYWFGDTHEYALSIPPTFAMAIIRPAMISYLWCSDDSCHFESDQMENYCL